MIISDISNERISKTGKRSLFLVKLDQLYVGDAIIRQLVEI